MRVRDGLELMTAEITFRAVAECGAVAVRELFIAVDRLLSPPHRREVFENYINRLKGMQLLATYLILSHTYLFLPSSVSY